MSEQIHYPLTEADHLAPDGTTPRIQDIELAYRLSYIEKPYRTLAEQTLMLGRQVVEREQALAVEGYGALANESMMDHHDFIKFAEAHGYSLNNANRTWNALARDGARAFGVTFEGSWHEIPLSIQRVYTKLNGLVPADASPTQKYSRISNLGIRQFGSNGYDLVMAYCQEKLAEAEVANEA